MKSSFYVLLAALITVSAIAISEEMKDGPFGGERHSIPGLIEAENYDHGPAGVAYKDKDNKNEGVPYREDTGVDIEGRPDASNGHGIGWTRKGEWLTYSVEVRRDGRYAIVMPVASNKQGGTFHIEMNGEDVTGPIEVPDTGGWQTLKTIYKRHVDLKKGEYVMKVVMDSEGPSGSIGDIDYFRFIRVWH